MEENNEKAQESQNQNRNQNRNRNNQNRNQNRNPEGNRIEEPKEVNGNVQPTEASKDGNTEAPNRNNQNRNRNNNNRNNQNRNNYNPNRNNQNRNNTGPSNENKPAGNKPTGNKPAGKGGKKQRYGRKHEITVDPSLIDCVERNMAGQAERLNPHLKLDLEAKGKVRITPLGGLGEIGGNITVFETETEAICVDIGMSFPDEDMHGVDILVPDFSYLHTIKDKLVGFVITHAHEDHIGAVPYLFREMQMPIYATPLPLAMIANKFEEHRQTAFKKYFRPVEKRKIIKIGKEFEVEWMHMTHSIIDSSSLAITTPMGTIIHTGDFKIDHTPIDGFPADLHRLAYYGEKGVTCLLSDSTNSYNPGITKSELSIAPGFDRIMSKHDGRILLSTFSSNVHRVQQAIMYGIKYGRKICVIGRSMERNLEIAMKYGYSNLPKDVFIDQDEVNRYNDKELLIVTTGSQGEPSSALFRMALGEHRHVKIKPSDLIVLSARAIPGNEAGISKMLNFLQKAGAKVEAASSEIHVSGHAAQEEQKLMLRLTNPKFFLPVHGEYNHVYKHAETAKLCGIPERNIILMDDGTQIEVTPKYMRKVQTIKSGKTYIDNQNNNEIENDIVLDRQKLASDGVVMIVAQVCKEKGHMTAKPRVTSFGLVPDKKDRAFASEMEDVLENFLTNIKDGLIDNPKALENDLRQVVRKHIFRTQKKYPLIVPNVLVM